MNSEQSWQVANLMTRTDHISGQVDLILPERPSIALTVSVNDNNQLSILHPFFPRPIGGVPYAPVLNGGLAPVRVLTQTGRIVIRSAAQ